MREGAFLRDEACASVPTGEGQAKAKTRSSAEYAYEAGRANRSTRDGRAPPGCNPLRRGREDSTDEGFRPEFSRGSEFLSALPSPFQLAMFPTVPRADTALFETRDLVF
jgi:hypothetical protein